MFVYIFMCMYIEKLYVVYSDSILSIAKAGRQSSWRIYSNYKIINAK